MNRRSDDTPAPPTSVSQAWFSDLYADKPDPWDLATKWHDRRKFAITVASLPRPHYRSCYEPGCANGELTKLLAPRCDAVLAVDFVPAAVAAATETTRDLPHVTVRRAVLPADLPTGPFDLVVISELLYYLSAPDMHATLDGVAAALEPGGDLVAVHCRDDRRPVYDGVNVHAALHNLGLEPLIHYEDEAFILDALRRPARRGVLRRLVPHRRPH